MGNCSASSFSSAHIATAKLILHDGSLQEFSSPIRASYILQKYPMCFICNSDDMDFDDLVLAVDENDELQIGQLYFVLPLSRLGHRLRPEEMAALAVKASSALTGTVGHRKNQILFSGEHVKKSYKRVSPGVHRKDNKSRRGKFTAKLSAIPE